MSDEDKIDGLAGKGEETVGRATDNPDLEAEGRGDQAENHLEQAGEKVEDVFRQTARLRGDSQAPPPPRGRRPSRARVDPPGPNTPPVV